MTAFASLSDLLGEGAHPDQVDEDGVNDLDDFDDGEGWTGICSVGTRVAIHDDSTIAVSDARAPERDRFLTRISPGPGRA